MGAIAHDEPELSAVVLGYRAGKTLAPLAGRLVDVLESLGKSIEVVLVANYHEGSADPTPEVAQRVAEADPRIRVVARAKGGGMDWDLRSRLAEAAGRVPAVLDGDGRNPPEDVARASSELVVGGHDVVKGCRITRHDGPYRRLLSLAYNLVVVVRRARSWSSRATC